MNSGELANKVLDVCLAAQRRIIDVGGPQYSSGIVRQAFEHESLDDLLQELEDELLDQINYAAMAILKIRARRQALESSANTSD